MELSLAQRRFKPKKLAFFKEKKKYFFSAFLSAGVQTFFLYFYCSYFVFSGCYAKKLSRAVVAISDVSGYPARFWKGQVHLEQEFFEIFLPYLLIFLKWSVMKLEKIINYEENIEKILAQLALNPCLEIIPDTIRIHSYVV